MCGDEITAEFKQYKEVQYIEILNAPAGGQAGAARC
jgi:hypothetical protein